MEHVEIEPSKLTLNEKNPRTLSKAGFERLQKSLNSPQGKELFKKRPCLVNRRLFVKGWEKEELVVYAGNQRARAACALNFPLVPATISELTPDEEREEMIKDNFTMGEYDLDMLANEFDAGELEEWGFDSEELFDEKKDEGKGGAGKEIKCPNCGELIPLK